MKKSNFHYFYIFFLIIIVLISIILTIYIKVSYNYKGILEIKNATNETLSNIKLIYSNSNETIIIPKLDNNMTYKLKINDSIEQSLYLTFTINKNNETYIFSDSIIGYIYKGYPSKNITIIKDNESFKIE